MNATSYNNGKVGFALFVSIWSFLSLLAHWTFPFIVAGAWAAFTTLLWLIAAAVISSASCTNVDNGLGRVSRTFSASSTMLRSVSDWLTLSARQTFRVCFSGYSSRNAMVAFAWIKYVPIDFSSLPFRLPLRFTDSFPADIASCSPLPSSVAFGGMP